MMMNISNTRKWNLVNFKQINQLGPCYKCQRVRKNHYEVVFYSLKTKRKIVKYWCDKCLLKHLKKTGKKWPAELVEERIIESEI